MRERESESERERERETEREREGPGWLVDAEITGGFRADAINAIRASALHAARGEFNAAIYVA
jgi:hypothetical protein